MPKTSKAKHVFAFCRQMLPAFFIDPYMSAKIEIYMLKMLQYFEVPVSCFVQIVQSLLTPLAPVNISYYFYTSQVKSAHSINILVLLRIF